MYASTLRTFGDEISELPNTLQDLKNSVSLMEKRCLEHLGDTGDTGIKILKFLRGEEEFPEDIEIKEIKKALEILRPILSKSLKEES